MSKHWLNIDQTPDELLDLYGTRDYYWYLRSKEYERTFMVPLAMFVNEIGLACLDVGCGEGILQRHLNVPYVGLEGSASAVARARQRDPNCGVLLARMEQPDVTGVYGTLVLSGILEVLVKPEHRIDFIELYLQRYNVQWLIVCDLQRLDTVPMDVRYRLKYQYVASMPPITDPQGQPLIDAKRHRKIMVYECNPHP